MSKRKYKLPIDVIQGGKRKQADDSIYLRDDQIARIESVAAKHKPKPATKAKHAEE